jgi:uncharacterized membrane protein
MKIAQNRFFLFLVVICILQILYYAPRMPEQMASHFDAAGAPNGWSTKTVFFGLYLGILGLLFLSFRVLPGLISRFPESMINLPNKEYWLAVERKDETFLRIRERLMYMGNGVVIFLIATFQLVLLANFTEDRRMNAEVLWILLLLFLIFTLSWTIKFIRLFRMPSEKSQ